MKTLIVYFSLGGNTKWMAEKIHRKIPNTTLHEVKLAKKPFKNRLLQTMVYGFKTTFYKKMAIAKSNLDMTQYDSVIIGAPVWVGNVPPPMLEFLKEYPIQRKKVAAFCSMGGEPSKFFEDLKKAAGVDSLIATLSMVEPLHNLKKEHFEAIDGFVEDMKEMLQSEALLA